MKPIFEMTVEELYNLLLKSADCLDSGDIDKDGNQSEIVALLNFKKTLNYLRFKTDWKLK